MIIAVILELRQHSLIHDHIYSRQLQSADAELAVLTPQCAPETMELPTTPVFSKLD